MTAYAPQEASAVLGALAVVLATLSTSFLFSRMPSTAIARAGAWAAILLSVVSIERITDGEPPGLRMLCLFGALLFGMKGIVSVEHRAGGRESLPAGRWFAFAVLWIGMRPQAFASRNSEPLSGWLGLIRRGSSNLALGALFIIAARWMGQSAVESQAAPILRPAAIASMMIGISLAVHFGLFHIMAGLWRRQGVECYALFRAPLRSRSLHEFWSRRWNLAFSEMTSLAVYRPLKQRLGTASALTAGFLFSGLLHEIAISVPVKTGFGLPLLYFAIHAAAMMLERSSAALRNCLQQSAWLGRAWTAAWLLVPVPILFHAAFLDEVVWPLIAPG